MRLDQPGIGFSSQPERFRVQAERISRGKRTRLHGDIDGREPQRRSNAEDKGSGDVEKALRLRLKEKITLVELLTKQLKQAKTKQEELRQEVKNLRSQNAALLADIDHSHANEGIQRSRSEEWNRRTREHKDKPLEMSQKVPFQSFAKTHVFEPEFHPKPKEYIFHGQRKESRTIKTDRRHIVQAQNSALELINFNTTHSLTQEHMVDGVYRVDINVGVEYEMYFRNPKSNKYTVVQLQRSLTAFEPVLPAESNRDPNELINLVLPLSGRFERFQQFLEMFTEVCIKTDGNVFLTVVLYGAKDFDRVRARLKNLETTYSFKQYQLIMRDKPFSRGRTLHDGVMYWNGKTDNVLMFFCDVDITFSAEFLRRCRIYTEPEKRVYYPMVFSLYNPRNVYEDGNIPSTQEQLKIGK